MTMGPTQAELIRQAMPTPIQPNYALSPMNAQNMAMVGATPMGMAMPMPPPPPPPSPMEQYMAAHASMFMPASEAQRAYGLGASTPFLDPSRAGNAMAQRALGGQSTLGKGLSAVGTGMSFIPGAQAVGMGLSFFGQQIGNAITNNPLTRWGYQQMYGQSIEDMTGAAQLQHGTVGNLQLTGGDAGLGGAGMGMPGALRLAQRFRGQAQRWAQTNPETAEQMGGGDAEEGARRYAADLRRLTQMAGEHGLLDAATNINQIGDTVQKLFKVLGKMGEITGDPDFRNNIQKIAQMRQFGFTIDQAATATRQIMGYQRAGGMTAEQVLGAQNMGMQTFGQAGLAPGLGMVYGPQAMLQARQLAGAYTPMQEALLGGREGIAQRWTAQQAQFATGPMNLMMGAAMTGGPGGTIGLDAGKLGDMLGGGTTLAGMAGQSQANMMRIARQMAQQQGRPVQDVFVELMQRQPEIQSQMMQQLGPEGMRMLQMRTIASLAQPRQQGGMGLGLHTAAQLVARGDPQQAQMLTGMMTSPEFYEREKQRLQDELRDVQQRAKVEAAEKREWRERMRDDDWETEQESTGFFEALSARESERRAVQIQQEEDQARGIEAAYFTETMRVDPRVAEEMAQDRYGDVTKIMRDTGTRRFEKARRLRQMRLEGRFGERARVTSDEVRLAQHARGEGGLGAFMERTGFGMRAGLADIFRSDEAGVYTDRVTRETERTMNQVWQDADIIEANKERGADDLAGMLKNLRSELTGLNEKGEVIDVNKAVDSVQQAVLDYAEKVGRGEKGVTFKHEAAREEIVKQLISGGMSPEKARSAVASNTEYWDAMISGVVRTHGTPTQLAAFDETVDAAVQFADLSQKSPEDFQKDISKAQDKLEDVLDELDISDRNFLQPDELGHEEKEALRAFTGEERPEVQEAVALMAMQDAEDVDDEAKEAAAKRLRTIVEEDTGAHKEAQKLYRDIKQKTGGKGAGIVGRLYKLAGTGKEAVSGLQQAISKGRKGEGAFGVLYKGSEIAAQAVAQGYTVEGDKIVKPGAAPETEEGAAIEKQIANLDEMKKQFAGFGESAQTLKIAANAQIAAAKMLGGGKVEKVIAEFYKDMNK